MSSETEFSDSSYESEDESHSLEEESESSMSLEEEEEVESENEMVESEVPRMDFSVDFENDTVWDNREDMLNWARQVDRERMMMLTIKTSNQTMVRLACHRHDKYRSGKKGEVLPIVRPPSVRTLQSKCNCKFELVGVRSKSTGKWALTVGCGIHNHDLPSSLLGYSFMGRMTEAQKELVRNLSYIYVPPRRIVEELRALYPGNVTSTKQVSNMRAKFLIEDRGNMTVTQYALHFLQRNEYRFFPKRMDNSDHIEILFFVHPISLHLLRLFPYVVIIDSTYKTNRYDMTLLEMVGFTCTNKSFNIGFAFISKEDTESYTWVLKQLKRLFAELGTMPNAIVTDREKAIMNAKDAVFGDEVKHLLCWVHVKMNIKAYALCILKDLKAAERFAHRCWGIFMSSTEAKYEERFLKVKERWPGLMPYVEKSWLGPYKQLIVRAWTEHCLHFQTRTTNRVEGMHHVLKKILDSSRGGFNTVIGRIHHQIVSQVGGLRGDLEMARTKLPTKLEGVPKEVRAIFVRLFYRVSTHCIKKLLNMFYSLHKKMSEGKMETECDDYWWRERMGLLCPHRIAHAIVNKQPIMPSEIHSFWHQVVWDGIDPQRMPIKDNVSLSIYQVRMELMIEMYKRGELTEDQVYCISESFVDMVIPQDSSLLEPIHSMLVSWRKGRPKGSTKGSTKRSSTLLEHRMSEYEQEKKDNDLNEREEKEKESNKEITSTAKKRGRPEGSTNKAKKKIMVDTNEQVQNKEVVWLGVNFGVENVNPFMFPYIVRARDVAADGHCGYRSFAEVLGYGEGQYHRVRKDLSAELRRNRVIYERVGNRPTIDELLQSISYVDSPCMRPYWLEMPIGGLIFATLHQVTLVMLSWNGSHTCLHMMGIGDNRRPPTKIYAIALVGQRNHFIPVWLKDDAPLHPPPIDWTRNHDPSMKGWDHPFTQRMETWRELRVSNGLSPNVGC